MVMYVNTRVMYIIHAHCNDFNELAEYGIGISYFITGDDEIQDDDLYEWEGINTINTHSNEDEVRYLVNYIDYILISLEMNQL